MYLQGIGVEANVTMAIKCLEKALEGGEYYEAASMLAHIYLTNKEVQDRPLGIKYLDQVSRDGNNVNGRLMVISVYYEKYDFRHFKDKCHKVMNLISDLQYISELDLWHIYGYKKYTFGKLDEALTTFTFAALSGHKPSTSALACKHL